MNRNQTLLNKLERKWGKYAIPNLTIYLVAMYVIGWILNLITNGASEYFLRLDMNMVIMHGQIWRLFTFLLIPKDTSILIFITIIFYASIGQTLEHTWGTFYYNVYVIYK